MKQSLTQLAGQIESAQANADWAAHKATFAAQEAEQERQVYLAKMERDQALFAEAAEPEEEPHPHGKLATPDQIRYAFEHGGRAVVTLKSHKTGQHVRLTFVTRKKKPGGGWISRATTAGRVAMSEADVIEVRDPDRDYPDNYVGRMYLTGNVAFKAGKEADATRAYAAQKILGYALDGEVLASEVRLAAQCSYCGHELSDPISIDRGVGPECYGKYTGSKAAPHGITSGSSPATGGVSGTRRSGGTR